MIKHLNKYFLYRHIRLDKNIPFYIGIGRKYDHYTSYEKEYRRAFDINNRTKFWKHIINKTAYEVEILMESDDYTHLEQKEREFIKLYGRKNIGQGSLANLTDGGGGSLGYRFTEETKKRISELRKKLHKEGKLKSFTNSKEVYQYTLAGEFVKRYSTINEAEKVFGSSGVSKAASGKNKTCKGFFWSYVYTPVYKIPEIEKTLQPIYQYSISGTLVKKWNDKNEIIHIHNYKKDTLNAALNGKNKSAYGYQWSYSYLGENIAPKTIARRNYRQIEMIDPVY
jgi:hypothetical protein